MCVSEGGAYGDSIRVEFKGRDGHVKDNFAVDVDVLVERGGREVKEETLASADGDCSSCACRYSRRPPGEASVLVWTLGHDAPHKQGEGHKHAQKHGSKNA